MQPVGGEVGAVGEAGIFSVHRVLLEDPALLDAARDLISLGKSAGFAWREAIRAQIVLLSNIEDALLAERAADLRDIEKRVLRALGYTNAAARELPDEAVLAADEFTPSDLSSLDRTRVTALVMARGGATSHWSSQAARPCSTIGPTEPRCSTLPQNSASSPWSWA